MEKTDEILKDFVLIDGDDKEDIIISKISCARKKSIPAVLKNPLESIKKINNLCAISNLLKCNNVQFYVHNDIKLARITGASGIIFDEIPEEVKEIEKFLGSNVKHLYDEKKILNTIHIETLECDGEVKTERPWKDEFSLISNILKFTDSKNILVKPGEDDCSLLQSVKKPVITTDTQKENVHFRRNWQSFFEIGYKAVTITLSDLAASFAKPVALFINLSLPETLSESNIEELYKGVNDALVKYSCELGGGNISRGQEFSIDLFAVGDLMTDFYPKRGNARKGELLCCTGPLGEAKAGLELLLRGVKENPLIERFKKPSARFDAVDVLIENGVKCATDISDGLSGDAMHIVKASDLSVRFNHSWISISEDLLKFCMGSKEKALEYIFSGGEDYQLLFTCSEESYPNIKKCINSVCKLGYLVEKEKEYLINLPHGITSFNHGKSL